MAAIEATRQEERQARSQREGLVQLLGGEKPYREFTFERYQVAPGNRLAFEKAKNFNPHQDSLYLWGPCGVGKTHLACAIARTAFDQRRSVIILRPFQLVRRLRMKDPDEEQALTDRFIRLQVFVLDDLGVGHDTAYARQILQEILDGRNFKDRSGLVITSQYSLGGLAQRLGEDTISSRLAQMCQVSEIKGVDYRLTTRRGRTST
jgi:DNA replication protein DnaC